MLQTIQSKNDQKHCSELCGTIFAKEGVVNRKVEPMR